MKNKTVIVLSGGMDSTTVLHLVVNQEGAENVKAISFDYGQVHKQELECAKLQCEVLGVEHRIIDVTFLKDLLPSALTGADEVPSGHYADESMTKTVVPFRNTILASIALGYASGINFNSIALGVHAGDHAIYPDCRPEWVKAMQEVANVGDYTQIQIVTPFLNDDKISILKKGLELGVDYSITWTSYSKGDTPDYTTGSSVERTEAFIKNNAKDPLYTDEEWSKAVEYYENARTN